MTRGRGIPADDDANLRALVDCWAPVSCVVGKTWDLHVEKVLRVDRDENLRMIAESVAFLRERGQAGLLRRRALLRRLRRPSRLRAGLPAERPPRRGPRPSCLCDTNGAALPMQVADVVERVVAELGASCRVGIHAHNDAGLRRGQLAGRRGPGRRSGAGHHQRLRRALRQRRPRAPSSPRSSSRWAWTASPTTIWPSSPRRPISWPNSATCLPTRTSPTWATTRSLTRAGCTSRRWSAIPAPSSTSTRLWWATTRTCWCRSCRARPPSSSGSGSWATRWTTSATWPTACSSRLKEKEHDGYHYEAADASFELLVRAEMGLKVELFHLEAFRIIVEKREDGAP